MYTITFKSLMHLHALFSNSHFTHKLTFKESSIKNFMVSILVISSNVVQFLVKIVRYLVSIVMYMR